MKIFPITTAKTQVVSQIAKQSNGDMNNKWCNNKKRNNIHQMISLGENIMGKSNGEKKRKQKMFRNSNL